jgi:hypothetical protein
VRLRESLSSQQSAFAKLVRSGQPNLAATDGDLASTEVKASKLRPYRMHRKLNPCEQAELVELYEAGASWSNWPKSLNAIAKPSRGN